MAGASHLVLDLPGSKHRLRLLGARRGGGTRELSTVGPLVVAIIALPAVAARLAAATRQFLVTLDLEAMAAKAAQAVALALADNAQLVRGRRGRRGALDRHAIGIEGHGGLGALGGCRGRDEPVPTRCSQRRVAIGGRRRRCQGAGPRLSRCVGRGRRTAIGSGSGHGDPVDIEATAHSRLDASRARRLEEVAAPLEMATAVTRLDLAHMGHALVSHRARADETMGTERGMDSLTPRRCNRATFDVSLPLFRDGISAPRRRRKRQ
jgi:hypothetical protein